MVLWRIVVIKGHDCRYCGQPIPGHKGCEAGNARWSEHYFVGDQVESHVRELDSNLKNLLPHKWAEARIQDCITEERYGTTYKWKFVTHIEESELQVLRKCNVQVYMK